MYIVIVLHKIPGKEYNGEGYSLTISSPRMFSWAWGDHADTYVKDQID